MSHLLDLLNGTSNRATQSPPLPSPPAAAPPATTIDQLFARLTANQQPSPNGSAGAFPVSSPSAPTSSFLNQSWTGSGPSGSPDGAIRQNHLLDLLKGGGSVSPQVVSPAPSVVRAGNIGREDRAQSLLASLMGGMSMPSSSAPVAPVQEAHNLPHSEPIIDHASPPLPTDPLPSILAQMSGSSVDAVKPTSPGISTPANETKFKFISPFDAFEDIKPVMSPKPKPSKAATPQTAMSPPPPAPKAEKPKPATPAVQKSKPKAETPATDTTGSILSTTANGGSQNPYPSNLIPTAHPRRVEQVESEGGPSRAATASPSAVSKKARKLLAEMPTVYHASGFVVPDQSTQPLIIKGPDTIIDIAEPNVDGLVHAQDAFEERPISRVKTDVMTVGISTNKTLSVSKELVAYALGKGGIRTLHQQSGANVLLAVRSGDDAPPMRATDIDVLDNLIAAVLEDQSLVIFEVTIDNEPAEEMFGLELKPRTVVRIMGELLTSFPRRVRWLPVSGGQGKSLLVRTETEILEFDVGALLDGAYGQEPNAHAVAKAFVGKRYGSPASVPIAGWDTNHDFSPETILTLNRDNVAALYDHKAASPSWSAQLVPRDYGGRKIEVTSIILVGKKDILVEYGKGAAFVKFEISGKDGLRTVSSIQFKYPPMPEQLGSLRLAAARYDPARGVIWITNVLRASIYAFRCESSSGSGSFDAMLEFPLEPIGDFAVVDSPNEVNVYYKHPRGYSESTFKKSILATLDRPPVSAVGPKDVPKVKEEPIMVEDVSPIVSPSQPELVAPPVVAPVAPTPKSRNKKKPAAAKETSPPSRAPIEGLPATAAIASPPLQNTETIDVDQLEAKEEVKPSKDELEKADAAFVPSVVTTAPSADLTLTLKKMEDRLLTKFNKVLRDELVKQSEKLVAHTDTVAQKAKEEEITRQETLISMVSEALDHDVKTVLQKTVQDEIKASVLPALKAIVADEISATLNQSVTQAVQSAIASDAFKQQVLAGMVVPDMAGIFRQSLTPIVDTNIRGFAQTILPQITAGIQSLQATVHTSVQHEMTTFRQKLLEEQTAEAATAQRNTLQMTNAITTLIEQVRSLSAEVHSLKAASASAIHPGPPPHPMNGPASGPFLHRPQQGPQHMGFSGMPNPPSHMLPPHPQQQQQQQQPQPQLHPSTIAGSRIPVPQPQPTTPQPQEDVDGVFLGVMCGADDRTLFKFVGERAPRTMYYLPEQGTKGPLSQTALLAIVLRLSGCLKGNESGSESFRTILTWIYRSILLLDRTDPTAAPNMAKIFAVSKDKILQVLQEIAVAKDAGAPYAVEGRKLGELVVKLMG